MVRMLVVEFVRLSFFENESNSAVHRHRLDGSGRRRESINRSTIFWWVHVRTHIESKSVCHLSYRNIVWPSTTKMNKIPKISYYGAVSSQSRACSLHFLPQQKRTYLNMTRISLHESLTCPSKVNSSHARASKEHFCFGLDVSMSQDGAIPPLALWLLLLRRQSDILQKLK